MSSNQSQPVRIELTSEQKEKIRVITGQEVAALEFTAEELEHRITPGLIRN